MKRRTLSQLVAALLAPGLFAASALAAMPDADFVELCKIGTASEIEQALADGANVDARDEAGATALMRAAEVNPDAGATRALLEAGAKADAQNGEGLTALMFAARGNHAEAAALLLEAGADMRIRDRDGHDALWHVGESARPGGAAEALKIVALLRGGEETPPDFPACIARSAGADDPALAILACQDESIAYWEGRLNANYRKARDFCADAANPEPCRWRLQEAQRYWLRYRDAMREAFEQARSGSGPDAVPARSFNRRAIQNRAEELAFFIHQGAGPGAVPAPAGQGCAEALDPLLGKWEWREHPGARPLSMHITPGLDDCRVGVEALWPHSPADYHVWSFAVRWNPEARVFDYEGGRRFHRIMSPDGAAPREESVYEDGAGSLVLRDGALLWDDRKEGVCADCRFTKSGP